MSKTQFDCLQIEYRSPHELKPHPHNATVHSKQQIRKLAKSMRRFGCVNPVLISDDKEIIAGHARVEAAKHIDLKLIPTVRLSSLTPAERLAYNLADNRLAQFAKYDRGLLAIQLEELTNLGFDEIEVTGFSLGDIDVHLELAKKKQIAVGPDDKLPPPQKAVVSRQGDLWSLGLHRLLCGDASAAADCHILMCGEQADIVLTEGLGNLPTEFARAHGERSEGEYVAFLSSFLQLAKGSPKPGPITFVLTDWRHVFELLIAAEKARRRAYVLEANPANCDIIIRRFETCTGKAAQLAGDGATFKEAENLRVAGSPIEGSRSTNVNVPE